MAAILFRDLAREWWENTSNIAAYLVGLACGLTGKSKHPRPQAFVNPSFIEWMMGAPEGWTLPNGPIRIFRK